MMGFLTMADLCKCGCGGEIVIKPWHKWRGIPLYLHGHCKNTLGKECSKETRKKISESKKWTPCWNAGKTGIYSDETLKKIKDARAKQVMKKGRKHTEESKEKNRIAHLGKIQTEEAKKKISLALKGKPKTEEHRKNFRESMLGDKNPRRLSAEVISQRQDLKNEEKAKRKKERSDAADIKRKEYIKKYCEDNKEIRKERWQLWSAKNPGKKEEYNKAYRQRPETRESQRNNVLNWRSKNPGFDKKYRLEHPEKHRDIEARRRARKKSAITENISSLEIYERDNWICQICESKVDQKLKWPDLFSPSIDHIIPISKGGSHTSDNVRLAHLFCNIKIGARGHFINPSSFQQQQQIGD